MLRYQDYNERNRDERWRLQCQLCKFIRPSEYDVPVEYYLEKGQSDTSSSAKEREKGKAKAVKRTSIAPHIAREDSTSTSHTYVTLKSMLPNPNPKASRGVKPNLNLDEHIVDDEYMSADRKTSTDGQTNDLDLDANPNPNGKLIVTGEEGVLVDDENDNEEEEEILNDEERSGYIPTDETSTAEGVGNALNNESSHSNSNSNSSKECTCSVCQSIPDLSNHFASIPTPIALEYSATAMLETVDVFVQVTLTLTTVKKNETKLRSSGFP